MCSCRRPAWLWGGSCRPSCPCNRGPPRRHTPHCSWHPLHSPHRTRPRHPLGCPRNRNLPRARNRTHIGTPRRDRCKCHIRPSFRGRCRRRRKCHPCPNPRCILPRTRQPRQAGCLRNRNRPQEWARIRIRRSHQDRCRPHNRPGCPRSRPRRRTPRHRPHPQRSRRHTRPRRRVGCRCNRSRLQGCQHNRTRRQPLHRHTRRIRPVGFRCNRNRLRARAHIHIRRCPQDRCTRHTHQLHPRSRPRCRTRRRHPRLKRNRRHTRPRRQVGCRRNRSRLQGCPHNRTRTCRQGRCTRRTRRRLPRNRPRRHTRRRHRHLPHNRRRTRQGHRGTSKNRRPTWLPRSCTRSRLHSLSTTRCRRCTPHIRRRRRRSRLRRRTPHRHLRPRRSRRRTHPRRRQTHSCRRPCSPQRRSCTQSRPCSLPQPPRSCRCRTPRRGRS